jgi:hypothetical protein
MRVLIPQFDGETQVTFVYRHDSFFQSVRRCGIRMTLCTESVMEWAHFAVICWQSKMAAANSVALGSLFRL